MQAFPIWPNGLYPIPLGVFFLFNFFLGWLPWGAYPFFLMVPSGAGCVGLAPHFSCSWLVSSLSWATIVLFIFFLVGSRGVRLSKLILSPFLFTGVTQP